MEGPGRVSNKLSLRLSDHLLPSIPHSDFNLRLRTYRSLYLETSSKPSHSPSLPDPCLCSHTRPQGDPSGSLPLPEVSLLFSFLIGTVPPLFSSAPEGSCFPFALLCPQTGLGSLHKYL